MKLEMIKVADCIESETNPRGGKNEAANVASFKELVASIKQQGILQPVLARKVGNKYEIVAGSRRFRAAQELEMIEIPAQIAKMTDVEASEAQIVENLQRQDIHPLDEGTAYRLLIEKSKPRYTTADVAVKVGKSESYVRDRLALTNLCKKGRAALKAGDLGLSHAQMIAKLDDEKMQNEAVKEVVDRDMSIDRLRDWIAAKVYQSLGAKPWANDKEMAALLGDDGGKETLFGKKVTEDPVLYAKQMSAYISLMVKKAEEKGEKMVRISTRWGKPEMSGVLAQDQYRLFHSKEQMEKVKEVVKGIVAEGHNDIGRVFNITTSKDELKERTVYKKTAAEKASAKKERDAQVKRKEKENAAILKAVGKVKWPISQKHLDALFDLVFRRFGYSYLQPVAARHGVKAAKKKTSWGETRDLETPLAEMAKAKGNTGKIQLIFEIALESSGGDGIKKL